MAAARRGRSVSSPRLRGRLVRYAVLLPLPLVLSGCVGVLTLFQRPRTESVGSVVQRDVYLDATIGADPGLRFFFPTDETCRSVIVENAEVEYIRSGPFGQVRNADDRCIPVGIGSLRHWRSQTTRAPGSRPIPRSHSSFTIIYQDEDYLFARGTFLLAGRVGWTGGDDTIAVVPIGEGCDRALSGGVASMEFRNTGPQPLVLLAGGMRCPISGLVMPSPVTAR